MTKLYSLILGSCTDSVQILLKAQDKYEQMSKDFNCIWLLKKVKIIVPGINMKISPRVLLHTAIFDFFVLRQYGNEANDAHLTRRKSAVVTLRLAGGDQIFTSEHIVGKELELANK